MNEPRRPDRRSLETIRAPVVLVLTFLWALATASLWVIFALAPVGVIATANAGRLASIRGTVVTTTTGYFQVSDHPSALVGTPMMVIRTNSAKSNTGLQLCAAPGSGSESWCSDLTAGYAGKLSTTAFGQHAWSYNKMVTHLIVALAVTIFGWCPGAILGAIDLPGATSSEVLPTAR